MKFSGTALLLFASYFIAARLSLLMFSPAAGFPTPAWPAAGIALGALLLTRDFRFLFIIFLAAFAVEYHFKASFSFALVSSLGNTLEAWIAASLILMRGNSPRLDRLPIVLGLIFFAATVSTLFSASMAALGLSFIGHVPLEEVATTWRTWWAGDAIGILVITPLMLVLGRTRLKWTWLRFAEALVMIAVVLVTSALVFYDSPHNTSSYAFALFPVICWAALRFEQSGVALATFLTSVVAIYATYLGHGPFARPGGGIIYLQIFLAVFAATGLMLGAVISERRVGREKLAVMNARLGEKVKVLKHSRDQLDIILGGISDGISVIDENGRIIYMNNAGREIAGFPGTEVPEMSAEKMCEHFDVRDESGRKLDPHQLPYVRAINGETTPEMLLRIREPETGEIKWLLSSSRPVVDESSQKRLAVSISKDFTRRKRIDDSIKLLDDTHRMMKSSLDYEYTLSQLVHFAVLGLADWSNIDLLESGGRLHSIASAHRDPEKALILKDIYENRLAPPIPHSYTARVMLSGESALVDRLDEGTLGTRSGMVVPLITRNQILGTMTFGSAESGRKYTLDDLALAEEVGRRAAIAIDNAALYRQAQKAIQMRDEFLSIASHELKTPITALKLQLQLRRRLFNKFGTDHFETEKFMEMLDHDDRQMERLTRLVEEMLDITRFQSGPLQLKRESVELRSLVQEVIQRHRAEVLSAGCEVRMTAARPVFGFWDRARTEQMFSNVFINAIKFGPKRPIEVSLFSEGGVVRLVIRDHGIGIDKENFDRIFQQFERVGNINNARGLGMGLYIARKIAEAHGGAIKVESEPNAGSSFTIELPPSLATEASHA